MNRRAVPVVLLLLLVVPPSVPVADASSPPQLVCGVCGPGFTYAAHERGVPLRIERSELTVRVDEGGTGHWNASVVVDDAAARRFREDPSLLDAIARNVYASDRRTIVTDPSNLSTRTKGDTVVVSFDVPDMARQGVGGVLLVDYFNSEGADRYYDLDADRFVLRGPDGTVVANDPPDATRKGDAAIWTSDGDYDPFDDETYVAFGPDRNVGTIAAAQLSVAADAAPYVVRHLLVAASGPTIVFGVGLGLIASVHRRYASGSSPRRAAIAVVLSAVAWLLIAARFRQSNGHLGLLVVVLVFQSAGIGLLAYAVPERLSHRRLLALSILPAAFALVCLVAVDARLGWSQLLSGVAVALSLALFLPLGFAARRRRRQRSLSLGGAILLSPAVVTFPMVPVGGFGPGFASVLLGAMAVAVILGGAVLFHLGWALAGTRADGV